MPTQIKHKIGSGAPLASDLIEGELGLDTVNGRAYTENSVGSIVELGTNPAAEIQANAGIALPDSQKATFGASDDLQIYHDGSNSYITDVGTGNLNIRGHGFLNLQKYDGENFLTCASNGAVTLYYDNAAKLATTSTGIDVTGTVTADGLTVTSGDASGTIATLKGSSGFGFSIAASAVSPYVQTIGVGGGEEVAITSGGTRLALFQDGGDISFYDDAGVAKFFWDASAESLTVGNASALTNTAGFNTVLGLKGNLPALTIEDTGTGTGKYTVGVTSGNFGVWDNARSAYLLYGNSSGNVGIGTSSPVYQIDVARGAGLDAYIGMSGNGNTVTTNGLLIGQDSSGLSRVYQYGANPLTMWTNNAERMRIDSSGNLLVGTSTASTAGTTIKSGGVLQSYFPSGTGGEIHLGAVYGVSNGFTITADTGNAVTYKWVSSGTEKMRIDSSGNLLVGTTTVNASGSNVAGVTAQADGRLDVSSTVEPLDVNRISTDGTIVNLRKDGTTVGSIGCGAGTLGIGQGTGNLGFFNATIVPMGNTSGGASDGVITLGGSARRFKDLYLSGGVYLGGTGAANHLDDYEEGTWTPTVSTTGTAPTIGTYSNRVGLYTKVGNVVHLTCFLRFTCSSGGTGDITITGLPFNSTGNLEGIGTGLVGALTNRAQGTSTDTYLNIGTVYITHDTLKTTYGSGEYITFTCSYTTSA